MKQSEKLFDAVTGIRDDIVEDATAHKFRGKGRKFRRWAAPIAAVLAITIAVTSIAWPTSPAVIRANAIAQAEYPEMAPYPDEGSPLFDAQYEAWSEDIRAQRQPSGHADGLESFWSDSIQTFLATENGENKVFSPVNVYLALCMLAEVTGGETRQQILDAMGGSSMEAVREQANQVWNANYRADSATTCLLASSLWLNENISFHQETMDLLAENYYASSYQGPMDLSTTLALQNWLNEQTGGLLDEQISGIELSPLTILALATTISYQVRWANEFNSAYNVEGIFHGTDGDTTVEYMTKSPDANYYWADQFAAVSLSLENAAGHMWLILPDEGVSPEQLLQDTQVLDFINTDGASAQNKFLIVNLSVPKFDISAQTDLSDGLKAMGITDVFDFQASDFSPMTSDTEEIALDTALHGVRVAIDEEGITAAAYTAMLTAGAAEPPDEEVDFVLDRPFLFVITGADGVPLFVGVVNQI